jgi:hypothetical protein
MPENREPSRPSRVHLDRDRAAKAECRTAAMHGMEGSDCTVRPVNQPNNGGPPSAEVGEERVQTQENTAHSRTRPTQSGIRVSPGGRGVRQAALLCRQHPR